MCLYIRVCVCVCVCVCVYIGISIISSQQTGKPDLSRDWFIDPAKNEEAFHGIPHRFRRFYHKQHGYAKTSIPLLDVFDLAPYETVVDLGGKELVVG